MRAGEKYLRFSYFLWSVTRLGFLTVSDYGSFNIYEVLKHYPSERS